MIVYVEPDEDGPHEVIVRVTEEEAIRRAKAYAAQKGHVYPNDQEALTDFMVIHWAWREE